MTISCALVEWFGEHARSLPWRTEPRDAYRTLISEIMLQQTQVDRVAPRFVEFVRRWPDLEALSAASEDDVLALWSGLGYYRRARMLHRLAREVVGSGRDRLPENIEALRGLPGIGDYTAAAVGSLAFGLEAPVLDGNVQRVVARVTAFEGDPRTIGARTHMKAWVEQLFPGHHPGVVNEALMELGATVCTPSGPRCGSCPLSP
ncbi:MAG: A/G-specific adenine glycosylase, partial [Acidobacteriota bacterium]